MSLQYPDDLIFGIPEIDEQHKELFNKYNEFSDALDNGRCNDVVFTLFSYLEDFITSHFRFEERLIKRSNYPNAEIHLQEHIQTIDQLKQFEVTIHSDCPSRALLLSIRRHLIRVLINHVKNCDMRLCRHLLGLKEVHYSASAIGATNNNYKKIGAILVDSHVISNHTLELALEKQRGGGQKLGEALVAMEAVKAEDIVEAYAFQMGMLTSYVALNKSNHMLIKPNTLEPQSRKERKENQIQNKLLI